MHIPTNRTAHTTAVGGSAVDHCVERKTAQTANASAIQDRSAMQEDPTLYSRVLYHLSYVPLHNGCVNICVWIYVCMCVYVCVEIKLQVIQWSVLVMSLLMIW